VRVDSSSAAESGMGLVSWCLGVSPVAGSENEVGGGKCGGRGRPKAAILFLDGAFGGNCGTAIGMGSGWTGDRLGAGPGSWRRRRREGSGGRCAVCGAGGPRLFLGFLGGGFGGNCGWARAPESGWAWCWRRGAEKEERSGGRCGGGGGRRPRFFLGWGGLCLVGTAAPQSGWAADGPGMGFGAGPGVAGGEKEVGVGAQVRSAEQAGPQFFLEWGWGLWWERGNCARVLTRASRNRDGERSGMGLVLA
jgi:hypothetical protein